MHIGVRGDACVAPNGKFAKHRFFCVGCLHRVLSLEGVDSAIRVPSLSVCSLREGERAHNLRSVSVCVSASGGVERDFDIPFS